VRRLLLIVILAIFQRSYSGIEEDSIFLCGDCNREFWKSILFLFVYISAFCLFEKCFEH
jgi:hypothetical protein